MVLGKFCQLLYRFFKVQFPFVPEKGSFHVCCWLYFCGESSKLESRRFSVASLPKCSVFVSNLVPFLSPTYQFTPGALCLSFLTPCSGLGFTSERRPRALLGHWNPGFTSCHRRGRVRAPLSEPHWSSLTKSVAVPHSARYRILDQHKLPWLCVSSFRTDLPLPGFPFLWGVKG